jgi:formyltetrahydrofolate-dependent phosphoribosylglycinamide formyltransferase
LLQALLDSDLAPTIVAVGSDVPDAECLRRAERAGVDTFTCVPADFANREAWDAAIVDLLRGYAPDLIVSAGFMRILGPRVVQAFPGTMINTHPALLPNFPGAHAVRDALAAGVLETGCTVHVIDEGVDTGDVIAQRVVPILDTDDEVTLHERIKVAERSLLVRTVAELLAADRQG